MPAAVRTCRRLNRPVRCGPLFVRDAEPTPSALQACAGGVSPPTPASRGNDVPQPVYIPQQQRNCINNHPQFPPPSQAASSACQSNLSQTDARGLRVGHLSTRTHVTAPGHIYLCQKKRHRQQRKCPFSPIDGEESSLPSCPVKIFRLLLYIRATHTKSVVYHTSQFSPLQESKWSSIA